MKKSGRKIQPYVQITAVVSGAFVVLAVLVALTGGIKESGSLVYAESLDEVAVEVNGQALTLRDLAFYIVYDETLMEEQAEFNAANDMGRIWDVATSGQYLIQASKDDTMEKVIHDEIFYRMALEEGMELTQADEEDIVSAQTRVWHNVIYGDKLERLGVTEDDINAAIRKIGVAQKYQYIYAGMQLADSAEYDFNGAGYRRLLEENRYEIRNDVWDRVDFGNVTLTQTE